MSVAPKGTSRRASEKFHRAQPSTGEQERRKSWGKTWGAVGHEYKLQREAKGV